MCVIAYKPRDVKFPSDETLKTCFENNPDGAGFMYPSKDGVHIKKGFMTYKDFAKAVKPFKNTKMPMVFHFRITTHGGTTQEMTQPFPVTGKTRKLKALESVSRVGAAHNGIIQMTSDATTISDTALFIKRYMSMLIRDAEYYKDHRIKEMIDEMIGSKMAVLSKDGHVELIGSGWIHADDGLWYSNNSYKPWSWKDYYKGTKYTPYGYDYWFGNDDVAPWEMTPQEEEDWIEWKEYCQERIDSDGASCYGCDCEKYCMAV